jgi:hypothetical protein
MKHLLLLALLLVVLPAHATKPDANTIEFSDLVEVADCGDFMVMDDAWIIMESKDFYGTNGDYIRTQLKLTGFDDLYSDADPEGIHLTGTAHLNVRLTFDKNGDPLWVQQGLAVAIVVPGYGPLFFDAGKLIWNDATGELVFSAGRQHDWNFGDFEALCEYFDQE